MIALIIIGAVLLCGLALMGSLARQTVREFIRAWRKHWEDRAANHLMHMVRSGKAGL